MKLRTHYPTVVLSDIHLGCKHSKTEEVTRFLNGIDCDKLILNGDIIDGWQLQKPGKKWKQKHSDFFKTLMKMMERNDTEIVYVRGNHDDFLDMLAPIAFANISIVKDYIHTSHNKRYFVTHGDIFDNITTHMKWLAQLGDIGYSLLLWINKKYNILRKKRGLPYFSLSQHIKGKVKTAVSYISDFEEELVKVAKSKEAEGVICGHIHQAANRFYGDIHYLNSGDWVESLTALAEDKEGNWQILCFQEQAQTATQPLVKDTENEILVLTPAI